LLFAFHKRIPVLYTTPDLPFRYEDTLAQKHYCLNDEALWQQIHFNLTTAGLSPLSSKAEALSVDGNIIRASTSRARVMKFEFKKLFVFDPEMLNGMPPLKSKTYDSTIVYDWFELKRSGPTELEEINSGDNFINKIILYPTERIDHYSPTTRDLVTISYLPHDKVDDFDYTETMASFKILEMIKEAGIKGTSNGNHPTRPGEKIYLKPRIEAVKREVVERIKYDFDLDDRFEMCYYTIDDVANMFSDNMKLITRRLFLRNDAGRRYSRTYSLRRLSDNREEK